MSNSTEERTKPFLIGIVLPAVLTFLPVPFLWMRSLASPDFLLTLVILSLTGVSAYLMPSASGQMRSTLSVLQVGVTFFIVWKLAAGLGLYWASSSLVGVFQTLWLRYRNDDSRIA
jgi:membrane protein insertase Oxa1/YidC/SpoIIIJ